MATFFLIQVEDYFFKYINSVINLWFLKEEQRKGKTLFLICVFLLLDLLNQFDGLSLTSGFVTSIFPLTSSLLCSPYLTPLLFACNEKHSMQF